MLVDQAWKGGQDEVCVTIANQTLLLVLIPIPVATQTKYTVTKIQL